MLRHELFDFAKQHVSRMFLTQLPAGMVFHNLQHTLNVVDAVQEIAAGASVQDMFVLKMAAIFHDTGYIYHYTGHEDNSKLLAANFLINHDLPYDVIEQILQCIEATKMPQQPVTYLQKVICDADLYHLSKPDYDDYAQRLRREWDNKLNRYYTDAEWDKLNFDMLTSHRYFTNYGQSILQLLKQKNIEILQQRLNSPG